MDFQVQSYQALGTAIATLVALVTNELHLGR
jgi:hypothetical protein